MLSEDRVRAEVRRIADSIEVDTAARLAAVIGPPRDGDRTGALPAVGRRRRRSLVPLAAAASIAAVVLVGANVAGFLAGEDSDPEPPAPVVVAGTPDGTVPSVFGHTRASAGVLLEERGLEVRYRKEVGCEPSGRPLGTEPATGEPVSPGETVTVLLSYQAANTDCVTDFREPWQFLDFANGRGPSPRFADEVRVFVDGMRTVTLTGADAASGEWGTHSPLEILRRQSEQVLRVDGSYRMPRLDATTGTPPDTWCGVARPRAVADREALTLTIEFAETSAASRCPARVAVYKSGGSIDAVVAWSESADAGDLPSLPDVVGRPLAEARDALTAAGYPVRVEELETCDPRRGVVEQAPTQQDLEDDAADDPGWYGAVTLVVEVPHPTRDCAGLDAAAHAFLRFARGGAPPSWAPEVQQLLGYAPWATIGAAAADEPASWSFCSGVTPSDCAVSPLVVAARAGEVAAGEFSDVSLSEGDPCELIDRGGLPGGLPVERQVVIYPAEISSCDEDWSVWFWIDDEGRITAVNLLVPAAAVDGS